MFILLWLIVRRWLIMYDGQTGFMIYVLGFRLIPLYQEFVKNKTQTLKARRKFHKSFAVLFFP